MYAHIYDTRICETDELSWTGKIGSGLTSQYKHSTIFI